MSNTAVQRDSAMWLRLLLDSANEAFYTVDRDGITTLCNAAFVKMLGFEQESHAVGQQIHDLIHHSHPDGSKYSNESCPIYQCTRTGRPAHVSNEFFYRLDGTAVPVEYWVRPIMLNDELQGAICTFIDITERRAAEDRLQRNHHTFYNLIHRNPFGIYVVDADFELAEVSLGSQKVFENVRPLIGRDFAEVLRTVWAEPFASEAIGRFRHTLETGEPYSSPKTVERRGDIPRVEAYDWRIERVELPDSRHGVVCYFYDLSERIQFEAAIQKSEERLRRVLDQLFTFVGITTPGGTLIEVNRAPLEAAGVAADDVLGKPFWDAYWWSYDERVRSQLQDAVARAAAGETVRYDVPVRLARGELLTIDFQISPLRDSGGVITQLIPTGTVIEDRVRAQRELEELNRTLEQRVAQAVQELTTAEDALRQSQKMEAMGQLTGGVAHDFNNLLTPIIGSLDMLLRKGIGDDRTQRLLEGGLQSAERAKTLVQRLLAFARRQPLQPTPVDVADLLDGMVELVASTSGPRVKLQTEVSAGLPLANADRNQLEMAVLNLAVNARDAMPDGGTLTIRAQPRELGPNERGDLQAGSYVCLSVSDTGIGMDEETLARAVEPFFSTKGVGRGTGLGLSMAHGLAAQLGGTLTISSKPRIGTTVEIWLPTSNDAAEAYRAPTKAGGHIAEGTALLVDDEELVRASTAEMLRDLGYTVVEANSAEQALQLVAAGEQFDLLVTDHLMPGMTGTELARAVQERRPNTRVLVISGYADLEGLAPDLPRLTKPFRQDELAASLATADLTSND